MIIQRAKNPWHRLKRAISAKLASRKLKRGLPPPNIIHINFTGLGTDPNGDANGMRSQANDFLSIFPGSDYAFFSHAEMDANPGPFCDSIIALIRRGNGAGAYTKVIMRGHSFGGGALMFLLMRFARAGIFINLAIFYDPVPNPYLGQSGAWDLPKIAPANSLCFTQTHGQEPWLIFPCGTPVGGCVCVNVSLWTNGPTLYHSSMIADSRVWGVVLNAMQITVMRFIP